MTSGAELGRGRWHSRSTRRRSHRHLHAGAVSVMPQMTSQPCEISVLAASFSLPGSYQELRKIDIAGGRRIDALGAEQQRVGRTDDVGDREAADEAELARLRHVPGSHAGDDRRPRSISLRRCRDWQVTMPEQCSKATSGKRGATFCIGVPSEKLVPKISLFPAEASSRNTRSASCGMKMLSMTVTADLVAELRLDRVDAERMLLGPADLGGRRCVHLPDLQRLLGAPRWQANPAPASAVPTAPVYFRNSRLVVLIIVVTL